jgi:hypothetical protein
MVVRGRKARAYQKVHKRRLGVWENDQSDALLRPQRTF